MNITTDVEEINDNEGTVMHKQEEALQGIKKFFSEALTALQPEMDEEENGKPCRIIIHMLPPMEEWNLPATQQSEGLRITLEGYSEGLSIAIHQAIWGILQASASDTIQEHNN